MAAIDDLSNLLALARDPQLLADIKRHQEAKAAAEKAVAQVKIEKASLNDMQAKIDRNHAEVLKKQEEHAKAVAKHQADVAAHSKSVASLAEEKRSVETRYKEAVAKENSFREREGRLRALEEKLEAERADLTKRFSLLKQVAG